MSLIINKLRKSKKVAIKNHKNFNKTSKQQWRPPSWTFDDIFVIETPQNCHQFHNRIYITQYVDM